jgi:uncharacterized protein YecT (DUF1311 family)
MALRNYVVIMSLLLEGLTVQNASALAAGETCDPAIIDNSVIAAFCNSGAVRGEREKYPAEDWEAGPLHYVSLGGSCGVAGCSSSYLISQSFTTKGVNPQSAMIMATAHSGPTDHGRISTVRLARLAPADAIIAPSAWSLLCSGNENDPGSETTAGQRACLEKEVNIQQSQLDSLLGKVRATMAPAGHPLDPEWSEKRLALFEQSQKTWEDYRAATCEAAYHETYPGSFAPLERLDCLYSVTGVRAQELRRVYFSVE